jgi:Chalcone isomerase-like
VNLKILFLVITVSFPASGWAVEIAGVDLPDTLPLNGITLVLNGSGLRTKTIFSIKVYAAGLYLQEQTDDGGAVVAADTPMAIRMVFIYDGVSPEKLVDAWNEGFENTDPAVSIVSEIGRFNACFSQAARKGDVYDLIYIPGKGMEVTVKGVRKAVIPGLSFKKALFSIWLGDDPCDDDLKEELLGKVN